MRMVSHQVWQNWGYELFKAGGVGTDAPVKIVEGDDGESM